MADQKKKKMLKTKSSKAEEFLKKRKHRPSETLTPESRKKGKKKARKEEKKGRRKTAPRLPSTLRNELDNLGRISDDDEEDSDEGGGGIEKGDVYEYEEGVPQEETRKNRRFDPVDNLEYELPDEFEDEDLPSDDEVDNDAEHAVDSDGGEEDRDKHLRMLQGITGMPGEAFEGKKRKEPVFSDVHGMGVGDSKISIQDLLDPLQGKPGYSKLRKRLHQLEKKPMAIQAPLSKVERERLERKVAYEHSKKDITKWEPLVKRNREAPTIFFEEDVDLGYSTVGAIAYEFEPRTEFEKKMALLVQDPEVMAAHQNDGSRLLELNKISIEDVRDRQNRLAKMRTLLFRHEMKAKRIKKIKSKTYHRMLKKDRLKVASAELQIDSEAIKEQAMKQEFKRAEERMTLKHKNSSKWAKRILKRGLKAQDEGTRAALSEQLHQHALLSRKMNSMKDSSSSSNSEDSSDDDDDDGNSDDTDSEEMSKVLARAKEKTLTFIEEEDEMPKSGVLSLPFMVRGLKKKKEAALEQGRLAVQEYDMSLRQIDDIDEAGSPKLGMLSGRKVFGANQKQPLESSDRVESGIIGENSDSEAEFEMKENVVVDREENNAFREVQVGSDLPEKSERSQETIFKSFDDVTKDAGPRTTYEVAIFASGSFRKMKGVNVADSISSNPSRAPDPSLPHQNIEGVDHHSDTDSEQEMVDGILSIGDKTDYELPSQADLIHRAFAGDDVEEEFEKDKLDVLNEENPEPEKPVLLPGWGQWTHIQKKKGLPSWMLKGHEDAKKKREETLKKRKDARLKHVIISEKIDKKAEKLQTKTLPFPFTSKEVFEQSIRMPIGPEYNPAISVGALNRPAVVKKAGVIIKPIKFEEVDPHEKLEEHKQSGRKPKIQKDKTGGGKMGKKASKRKGS